MRFGPLLVSKLWQQWADPLAGAKDDSQQAVVEEGLGGGGIDALVGQGLGADSCDEDQHTHGAVA